MEQIHVQLLSKTGKKEKRRGDQAGERKGNGNRV